jgi:hypothetical protein
VAGLRTAARAICDLARSVFQGKRKVIPSERVINEFFKYGSQYYVAGRYGMFAGLMPVAGNVHHHAIEMLLKGTLSSTMDLDELKTKLRHRLPRIWREFKKQATDPTLTKFDKVIRELNKFEDIRYPDNLLRRGASLLFDITKAGASQSFVSGVSVPQYRLCLEDIDELVEMIFRIANRNPAAFLGFMKDEARQVLRQDNQYFTS